MIATDARTIYATDTPTLEQMQIWWAEMHVDPTWFVAYPDYIPTDLDVYLEAIQQKRVAVWVFTIGDGEGGSHQVGGAYYMHDSGENTDGHDAWVGVYIMPPYRGHVAVMAWNIIYQKWVDQGLYRLFAAVRATNRPARLFIT